MCEKADLKSFAKPNGKHQQWHSFLCEFLG